MTPSEFGLSISPSMLPDASTTKYRFGRSATTGMNNLPQSPASSRGGPGGGSMNPPSRFPGVPRATYSPAGGGRLSAQLVHASKQQSQARERSIWNSP